MNLSLPLELEKYHKMGLILIPLTIKDGKKQPLVEYKGYKEKYQDLPTLQGLYETYKDITPLHWAVYCVNGVVGLDFDTAKDYETFFSDINTLTTRSPSGGYHAFLRSLTPCKSFDVLGIEVKVNVLCTISGEGYNIFKDAPIKEFDDAETFLIKKFPKIKIDKKASDIKIQDVITKFTKLIPSTKDHIMIGKCPLHGDTDDEHLYIYENTNSWYCFKCKKGGDAFEFVKALKNVNFEEAKRVTEKLLETKLCSKKMIQSNGAFDYIDRITEKNPIYYDEAGQFWLWDDEGFYKSVDNTEILLILLRNIADPSIIKTTFKGELLEAARLRGRAARVKPVPNTWIHLQNGVYDTRTGAINEATPEYLFTYPIPHKLSYSEDTPTIDRLFSEWVTPEKVPLLNEIAAYCLYNGYPIHRMFVLLGRGRNGKGQYRDFIVNLVGIQNRSASTLEQLINSRFETARLFNKKVCTMGEINYTLLDRTAILKMLSGGDPIPGEMKNKTPFEFVNTAKLLINTNSLPQTSDKTDAFYSRCIIVEFGNQWLLGKDIIDTIPDEEYDNFLTKSLRVLSELLDRGVFSDEGNIQDKEKEYERLSNPLTQFINIYYDKDINGKVAAWRLMDEYVEYCVAKGYRKPENKSSFNKLLKINYEIDKKNLIDEEDGIYKNWVWVFGIKPKVLPTLPVLPEFPLKAYMEESCEVLGKVGKTGKTNNSGLDENLPFDTIIDSGKTGKIGSTGSAPQDHIVISKIIQEWESMVHGRPMEYKDRVGFVGWYFTHRDKNTSSTELLSVVDKIKKFTSPEHSGNTVEKGSTSEQQPEDQNIIIIEDQGETFEVVLE